MTKKSSTVSSVLVAVAALAAIPGTTKAQDDGPALFSLPASTSAGSLGDAYMLSRPSSDVVFYNPALLGRGEGIGFAYGRYAGDTNVLHLSGATDMLGGTMGVGLQTYSYGVPNAFTSETVASLAHARTLFGLRFGVTAKLGEVTVDEYRDEFMVFDLGLSEDLGPITVGLSAQHIGEDLGLLGDELGVPTVEGRELDERITAGAAFNGYQLGELDIGAAFSVSKYVGGDFVPGGGLEVAYWPVPGQTFIARVGARRAIEGSGADWFTFGLGAILDGFTVEYAFQGYDGVTGAHLVSLTWR